MTRNQLQYHANMEIMRANKAKEAETLRSNLAKEQENYRSNKAKEWENFRHNTSTEDLESRSLANKMSIANEDRQVDYANASANVMKGIGSLAKDLGSGIKSLTSIL